MPCRASHASVSARVLSGRPESSTTSWSTRELAQARPPGLEHVIAPDRREERVPVLGSRRDVVLPMRRIGQHPVDVEDRDHCAASSSGRGHEHTRLRSPKAPSMRRTGGQYLSWRRLSTGKAARRAG